MRVTREGVRGESECVCGVRGCEGGVSRVGCEGRVGVWGEGVRGGRVTRGVRGRE